MTLFFVAEGTASAKKIVARSPPILGTEHCGTRPRYFILALRLAIEAVSEAKFLEANFLLTLLYTGSKIRRYKPRSVQQFRRLPLNPVLGPLDFFPGWLKLWGTLKS